MEHKGSNFHFNLNPQSFMSIDSATHFRAKRRNREGKGLTFVYQGDKKSLFLVINRFQRNISEIVYKKIINSPRYVF